MHDVVEEELLRDDDRRSVSDLDDSEELVVAVKDSFCVGNLSCQHDFKIDIDFHLLLQRKLV